MTEQYNITLEELQKRREIHLERRLSDENEAIERINALGALYKCFLIPHIDKEGKFVAMAAASREPDNEQTRSNIEQFTRHLIETKEHYQIEFFPIYTEENGELKLTEVIPMVTW